MLNNKMSNNVHEDLRQSSEILSTIFDLNPDAIVLTKVDDGEIIDCNQEYLNQIGYTRDEVIGHNTLELNLYSSKVRNAYLKEIHDKKTVTNFELNIRRKDGNFIDVLYSSRYITVKGEEILLNIGKDITKRRNIEKQIEYHALLLNKVNDAVIGTDSNFNITYWNKGAEQMYGYTETEALGKASVELLRPEYAVGERERIIKELNDNGNSMSIIRTKHRNNTEIIVEVNSTRIIDSQNNITGYVVVYRNITKKKESEKQRQALLEKEQMLTEELQNANEELKSTTEELQVTNEELINQGDVLLKINQELVESEEKFLKAFHANPAAMTLSDEDGRWIDVNESYTKLTGYTKDELLGHTSSELNIIGVEEREQYIIQSKKNGSSKDVDLEIRTKSGVKRTVISNSEYIEIGNRNRFITFIYDITERKEKEKLSNALNTVNAAINTNLDYNEIMQSIINEGTLAIGAESSVINLREGKNWIVKFAYNFPDNIIGQIKSDAESPTSVYVADKKETTAFNDAQNDSRVDKRGMKLYGIASVLVTPIIMKDKVKGIIAFYHHKKQVVFNDTQIDFANKLATSLSQAIENAELFEDIKAKEEKYHSLYSSMNEGVALHEIIYNPVHEAVDYIINDVNPAYEKILDMNKQDVVDKKASVLYGTGNPPFLDIYAEVAENGIAQDLETYFEPMNKYFRISIISPEKGKFATVFEDITERKIAEETIKQQADIIELSFDAIIVGQIDGDIERWNKGAEQLYGYSEKEAVGQPVYELLHTVFPVPWPQMRDELQEGGIWEGELKHRTKSGEKVIVSSRIQIIMVEDGSLKVVETNRDITHRKQAEEHNIKLLEEEQQLTEELSATNEELQATSEELQSSNEELIIAQTRLSDMVTKLKISNKELEQFAYVASHDLQEPLRMVSSFTQLLERRYKGNLDDDADDYIDFIVEGAKRMKDLIDDLLTFSRLNTTDREFELILMEIALDDVLTNLKASIKEYNVQITHNILPTIKGDRIQINQLLQNLISNAIKFHSDKPPKIHISSEKLGKYQLFSISDNGIGIDPQHQEQIFSIFKRLHTRKEYEGTGIGLSICKRIVERHGGEIWVESEPQHGSTFYFTIPEP